MAQTSTELIFGSVAMLFALAICMHQIIIHMKNYHQPDLQRCFIRILLIIPVYSTLTFMSLMYPESYLSFNMLRDCYEAYVLYIFLKLLVFQMGGENALQRFLNRKRYIHHLWPLKETLMPIRMNGVFLRRFKQGVLQFVFVKPLTSIVALIADNYGCYKEGDFALKSPYLYISLLNNMSISISLYALGLFYHATIDHLRQFSPFSKFLCIKSIIFFSYWQSCLFTVLMKYEILNDLVRINEVHNLIISFEIFLAANIYVRVFSYKDVEDSEHNKMTMLRALDEVFTFKDVFEDAQSTFLGGDESRVGKTEMHIIKLKEGEIPSPQSL